MTLIKYTPKKLSDGAMSPTAMCRHVLISFSSNPNPASSLSVDSVTE